jgi:hypothetical protein
MQEEDKMSEQPGAFTIPTLLYLSPTQRAQLEYLVHTQETDLAELVSQIVATYLQTQPEPPAAPPAAPVDKAAALRQRRVELARLRAQHNAAGQRAPTWLGTYIAELEAEIQRLEE